MSPLNLSLQKTDKICALLTQAAACSDLAQVGQGLQKAAPISNRFSKVAADF